MANRVLATSHRSEPKCADARNFARLVTITPRYSRMAGNYEMRMIFSLPAKVSIGS